MSSDTDNTKDSSSNKSSISYRDAGVDIEAGDELIERIKPYAAATETAHGVARLGGFGAAFPIDLEKWPKPVLISGTDGVGTKLKIAIETGIHDSIGIDLVAMCANDILVTGATPLFFLDYYATGALDLDVAESVIKGIADGCQRAGMTLSGGETAEMPGMYENGHYDLAGFAVGIVNKDEMIDGSAITQGMKVIGINSNGVHSNGFSLVRRVMEHAGKNWGDDFNDNQSFGDVFLKPTTLYCKAILAALEKLPIAGMAHITGGGLPGNLPRVLPDTISAKIKRSSWELPEEFLWLQQAGNIEQNEMDRTFNCGIGFCVIIAKEYEKEIIAILGDHNLKAQCIGDTIASNGKAELHYS